MPLCSADLSLSLQSSLRQALETLFVLLLTKRRKVIERELVVGQVEGRESRDRTWPKVDASPGKLEEYRASQGSRRASVCVEKSRANLVPSRDSAVHLRASQRISSFPTHQARITNPVRIWNDRETKEELRSSGDWKLGDSRAKETTKRGWRRLKNSRASSWG